MACLCKQTSARFYIIVVVLSVPPFVRIPQHVSKHRKSRKDLPQDSNTLLPPKAVKSRASYPNFSVLSLSHFAFPICFCLVLFPFFSLFNCLTNKEVAHFFFFFNLKTNTLLKAKSLQSEEPKGQQQVLGPKARFTYPQSAPNSPSRVRSCGGISLVSPPNTTFPFVCHPFSFSFSFCLAFSLICLVKKNLTVQFLCHKLVTVNMAISLNAFLY